MSKKILLLTIALMAAMMLNLAIMPAMAKPETITITVKMTETHKPVAGASVVIRVYDSDLSSTIYTYPGVTDSHGRFSCDCGGYPYTDLTGYSVTVDGVPAGSYPLSSQESARLTVWLPILS